MKRLALATLAALAGCASDDSERWRYGSVLWEREPLIRSSDDARALAGELEAKASLSLDDCFRLALQRSERIAIDGEELVRIQSLYDQSVGAVLPRLSFLASYTRQDAVDSSTGVQGSFTIEERTEYKFRIKQPIFSGLKEYYAIRQTTAMYEAKEQDLRQARLALYADVAEAFYAVLQVRQDLSTTEDSLRLARERLEELTQRARAGISRRSEVLAQEAEAASVQARVEGLRGVLAVAWEVLKFATGLGERRELVDALATPASLPAIAPLVERAVAERSDVAAAAKRLEAAENSIGVARSAWFPVVSVEGNYYTHREGVSEEVDWDLVVSGEIPLFDGFTTAAKVREAESDVRVARLGLERLRRQVELDLNRIHADGMALLSELSSLETAVESARENHETVQAEYRQGIVTNIEVLTAFTTLERATFERDRARTRLKLALVRLAAAAGFMPEELK